jgi:hypothetical protein
MNQRERERKSKPFFDTSFTVRLRGIELKRVEILVAEHPEMFGSVNHFIRAGIIKLLEEVKG